MQREKSPTMPWQLWLPLAALAVVLAWLYRGGDLGKRPMHTDEAILGVKTIELMTSGRFEYDPHDYHGPALHYFTRWLGRGLGWSADTLGEAQLRHVTALYGLGLLLIPLLLADALSRSGFVMAMLLIAASPMMTFYSRYYIMETPFVFYCGLFLAALWRWSQNRNLLWLVVAGASLGVMHATKETFVLNLFAAAAAWGAVKMLGIQFTVPREGWRFDREDKGAGAFPWIVVALVAVLVSVAFYSNFFQDWQGVRDSVLTFRNYLHRSGGAGHEKPWHYYITLIFWRANVLGTWTEALIGGLAFVGILDAFLNRSRPENHRAFLTFLSLYALALLAGYSIIPYKTPWSVLAVDHAFALLAGVGASALFRIFSAPLLKIVIAAALLAGIYNLCQQTTLATDFNPRDARIAYSSDERNPYVYSHTTPRVPGLAKRIHEFAALHPDGKAMPVQIFQAESGWPLRWYLRDLTRVGYHTTLPEQFAPPAVIIADAALQDDIILRLVPKPLKVEEPPPDFVGPPEPPPPPPPVTLYETLDPVSLRPGVLLIVMVEKNLHDAAAAAKKPATR